MFIGDCDSKRIVGVVPVVAGDDFPSSSFFSFCSSPRFNGVVEIGAVMRFLAPVYYSLGVGTGDALAPGLNQEKGGRRWEALGDFGSDFQR